MGITFEDIQRVNNSCGTVPIKGKDYVEVNQRIKAFRMLYPAGCISTELLSDDGSKCVFKATVLTDDGKILGTGTAFELQSSSFINKTSYIENCETSAIGRALAMCGIGIDVSIASAEELANALENQGDKNMQPLPKLEEPKERKQDKPVEQSTEVSREKMIECAKSHYPGDRMKELLSFWNIESIEKASTAQLMVVWNRYNR